MCLSIFTYIFFKFSTFVGPLAIATLISPLVPIVKYFGLNKIWMLFAGFF